MATPNVPIKQSLEYDRLSDAKTFIRVLKILSDDEIGHFRCTLQETTLKSQYQCLSYMWGNDRASHTIFVNDKAFFVRDNLWDFLLQARKAWTDESLPLWIDAICIDQQNVQEKNLQVASMGKIYSSATSVLSWLGKDDPLVEAAFDFIATNGFGDLDCRTNGGWRVNVRFEAMGKQMKEYWDAFDIIASLKYWTRLWTVQEILLAHDLSLQYGSKTISVRNLENVRYVIRFGDGPPGSTLINGNSKVQQSACGITIGQRTSIVKRVPYPSSQFFLEHFREFRFHECMDMRDKVYAIRSLGHEHLNIAVDYNASITSVAMLVWENASYTVFPIEDGFFLKKSLGLSTRDYLQCKQHISLSRSWNEKIDYLAAVKLVETLPQPLLQRSELWIVDTTTLQDLPISLEASLRIRQICIQLDESRSGTVLEEHDLLLGFNGLNFLLAFRRSISGNHEQEKATLEKIKEKYQKKALEKNDFDFLTALLQGYECMALLSYPLEDQWRVKHVGSGYVLDTSRNDLPLALTPRCSLDLGGQLHKLRLVLHWANPDNYTPSVSLKIDWAVLVEFWEMLTKDEDLCCQWYPMLEKVGSWDEECAKVIL